MNIGSLLKVSSAAVCSVLLACGSASAKTHKMVVVPQEDRFSPFELTIKHGDTVVFENDDTDDHTIVAVASASTTGPRSLDVLLPGTDNNGGKPGTHSITFKNKGTFTYYCRFHAMLDAHDQPVAPGPDGGIQSPGGNYGTPMMGIIAVK